MSGHLPHDSAERKTYPMYSGLLAYFPAALGRVAHHSYLGNEKHNPGQPLHHARGKSDDHLDCAARHLTEGDLEGAAWRILAALQLKCEAEGAPMAPGARNTPQAKPFPSPTDLPESPVLAALIELHDEDGPILGLKAGEAHEHNPAAYAAATARLTDEE